MDKVKRALSCFEEGFSCSQSVFTAYSADYGLEDEQALKLSESFGGGMALGETCGAVTGAFMILGLKYGRTEAGDDQSKQKTKEKVREFAAQFKELHGSITCKALLNIDISTVEGHQAAKEQGLFDTTCPRFVQSAVEILEQMENEG